RGHRVDREHQLGRALGLFLGCTLAPLVAPRGAADLVPAQASGMPPRLADSLAQPAYFLLRHARQNVGDQLRHQAAVGDAVHWDRQRLELVPAPDALGQLAAEAIQPLDNYGYLLALRP